jgi:hypothetical protein
MRSQLFNHLVGAGGKRGWDREPEYPGGLRVDQKFELGGPYRRKRTSPKTVAMFAKC